MHGPHACPTNRRTQGLWDREKERVQQSGGKVRHRLLQQQTKTCSTLDAVLALPQVVKRATKARGAHHSSMPLHG